jgi:hypothetical protein
MQNMYVKRRERFGSDCSVLLACSEIRTQYAKLLTYAGLITAQNTFHPKTIRSDYYTLSSICDGSSLRRSLSASSTSIYVTQHRRRKATSKMRR